MNTMDCFYRAAPYSGNGDPSVQQMGAAADPEGTGEADARA